MKPNSALTIREAPAASSSSLHSIIDQALNPFTSRQIAGPLREGHYVQISLGMGFYVPEAAFHAAQQRATTTGHIQFLGITRDGRVLEGDRETILAYPDSAGLVVWIVPGGKQ